MKGGEREKMKATYRTCAFLLALVVGTFIAVGSVALAGDYHKGDGLHCTDCHIMHASKDGTTYGGSMPNPSGY